MYDYMLTKLIVTMVQDYTEIHYWPDNWGIKPEDSSSFLNNWVDAHVAAAKSLKKPLVFEEFGACV
jgi:hypothetical protein